MTHHVLMSEPAYFRIAYEINPWMRRSNPVDWTKAITQWRTLFDVLLARDVKIELIDQDPALPDMTFTANAGIVIGERFLPANFRYLERQPESERFAGWFEERGYVVQQIHLPHYWEGEGDVLAADGNVFAGYRYRTEERALDHLDELLGKATIRLELADPRFYHLDTCLCPLGRGRAVYYPSAFSPAAQQALSEHFDDLIAVVDHDAFRFACNAVLVDRTVVLNTDCPTTEAELGRRGFTCLSVPTDEFVKAGGSVKCLVLTLDSFEASSS